METETVKLYKKEGAVQGAVGAVIALIVGVGVATLVLIFVSTLGGQTYNLVESDIDSITTIKDSIKNGVLSGFEALEQTGEYLPIIVLAVVIALVLALVLGMAGTFGGMGGGRSAL
jgi:hypothetical protein